MKNYIFNQYCFTGDMFLTNHNLNVRMVLEWQNTAQCCFIRNPGLLDSLTLVVIITPKMHKSLPFGCNIYWTSPNIMPKLKGVRVKSALQTIDNKILVSNLGLP